MSTIVPPDFYRCMENPPEGMGDKEIIIVLPPDLLASL
jgi:hypothetical protein